MASDFRITGTAQLVRLASDLRRAGRGDLRDQLGGRLRAAARPLAADLRSAIRSVPIRGERGSRGSRGQRPARRTNRQARPLRAEIADAITVTARTQGRAAGARVFIDRTKLTPGRGSLPARIDAGYWRHPVFGNKSRWVGQYGRAWWAVTIRRHEPRMRAEAERIVNQITDRLSRG